MGDFERHIFRTLHTIHFADHEGTKIAQLVITQNIERVERYNDDPSVPSGPASRRIVEVPGDYLVYAMAWGSSPGDKPLPKGLDELLASLKQHEGVKQGETLVGFDDEGFETACGAWITAQTGYTSTFVKPLGR